MALSVVSIVGLVRLAVQARTAHRCGHAAQAPFLWLTALSALLAVLFDLSVRGTGALVLSLLIGTPAVSAIGGIGAALTLSIRRGGLILPLIVLPLLAPAVIFGSGAVLAAQDGLASGALYLLTAFSLLCVVLSPFAVAASVRLNLAT